MGLVSETVSGVGIGRSVFAAPTIPSMAIPGRLTTRNWLIWGCRPWGELIEN